MFVHWDVLSVLLWSSYSGIAQSWILRFNEWIKIYIVSSRNSTDWLRLRFIISWTMPSYVLARYWGSQSSCEAKIFLLGIIHRQLHRSIQKTFDSSISHYLARRGFFLTQNHSHFVRISIPLRVRASCNSATGWHYYWRNSFKVIV